jgi:hypothetical protein
MVVARVLTVVCVLVFAVAPAQARKKNDPCRPAHATTEFDNGKLRLFSVPGWDGADAEYLCVWRTRKRFKLAEGSPADTTGDYVNGFLTTGRFFLYITTIYQRDSHGGRGAIRLLDTRSGKRRSPAFTAWPVDWKLTTAGTVAYTTDPSQGAPRGVYVLPLGAAEPQQVDIGEDIDPMSLTLARHTLYWTRGGQPHSVQIP